MVSDAIFWLARVQRALWEFCRRFIDTTGHAGWHSAPSGQTGTAYPLVWWVSTRACASCSCA
eukprot:884461-Prymnesium_polylepis.1